MFATTTGDDSTGAPASSCQSVRPVARSKAVTVPPCELTISRGPAIAGVDAVKPGARRDQMIFPVAALIATVRPCSRFTYRKPSQKLGGYSIKSCRPRAHTDLPGTPRLVSGRDRVRAGSPPNVGQHVSFGP